MYDRFGSAAFEQGFGQTAGTGAGGQGYGGYRPEDFAGYGQGADFSDIFGDVFGGRARAFGPRKGPDTQYALELSLKTPYSGLRPT
jgi:molecular chaperone DnaJ